MRIDLYYVPVRELHGGYVNSGYEGVVGYGGALDIRPRYQREFVYSDDQQKAVIRTILAGFPLNVMYWSAQADAVTGAASYEMLDGQQRAISVCEYIEGRFSVELGGYPKTFYNLSKEDQDKILGYELMVYFCQGAEDEKLRWFEVINIAGLTLRPQELRNAIYTGPWLTSAKRYFSRENQGAHWLSRDYVPAGEVKRQDLLQRAIEWHGGKGDENVKAYMNAHRQDANADQLWTYFKSVIDWAKLKFPVVRREMRAAPWPRLFDAYGQAALDADVLEGRVKALMADDEVTRKSGIYEYVLSGDERALGLRTFTDNQKREAYEHQDGVCPVCQEHFELSEMHGDHRVPWSKGGKTVPENCQMLCAQDNLVKGNR